jgi:hypothetical protein
MRINSKLFFWLASVSVFQSWILFAATRDINSGNLDPFSLEWTGLVDNDGATGLGNFTCLASIGQSGVVDIAGNDFLLSTAVIPSFPNWSAHQTLGIEMSLSPSGDITLSWPRYPFSVALQVANDFVHGPWQTISVPSPFSVKPANSNEQSYFRLTH